MSYEMKSLLFEVVEIEDEYLTFVINTTIVCILESKLVCLDLVLELIDVQI